MVCLALAIAPAHAFKIDPWSYDAPPLSQKAVERQVEAVVNNPRQILLGPVSWVSQVPAAMGQLKEPVHENLTELALRCASAPQRVELGLIVECAGRAQLALVAADLAASDLALIRGSRWSDAPPMRAGSFINPSRLMCGEVRVPENAACWAMLMTANGAAAAMESRGNGRPAVAAPDTTVATDAGQRRAVNSNLLRRSHYGDMQFLHAMASPGELPARTRERMLLWAKFTYQVAVGEIAVDTVIGTLELPFTSDILSGVGQRTVHQFFETRAGTPPETIRQIAMGALLHMVQDSFSPAHTVREAIAGEPPVPFGAIRTFNDYGCQSSEEHARGDRAESSPWLFAATRPAGDPVTLGAQLIAWSRAGVAWESGVRSYLESAVFPLATNDGAALQRVGANARCGSASR